MKHIVVLVLGDLGRSPRMQYHAYSFARLKKKCGNSEYTVSLVGYEGEDTTSLVSSNENINIFRLKPWEFKSLRPISILHAIFRGIALIITVFIQLMQLPKYDIILIQNPPCLPALIAANFFSWFNGSRVMLDWHNLGFAMFQERLGSTHLLVRFALLLERFLVSYATHHICVSVAMKAWLFTNFRVKATVLYDRPPRIFKERQLSVSDRHKLLTTLGYTVAELFGESDGSEHSTIQTITNKGNADSVRLLPAPGEEEGEEGSYSDSCGGRNNINNNSYSSGYGNSKRVGLVMSCTSWTPDEDFQLLLDALLQLETHLATRRSHGGYARIAVVVTGKGPMKADFERAVQEHCASGRLGRYVAVRTAWLTPEQYPSLLRCADLGVSLHTSSSGLDLPMKVLDMFGSAVPVCGYDFATLPELLKHGENGLAFKDSEQLSAQIVRLLVDPPAKSGSSVTAVEAAVRAEGSEKGLVELRALREGASRVNTWEENWEATLLPVLQHMWSSN